MRRSLFGGDELGLADGLGGLTLEYREDLGICDLMGQLECQNYGEDGNWYENTIEGDYGSFVVVLLGVRHLLLCGVGL